MQDRRNNPMPTEGESSYQTYQLAGIVLRLRDGLNVSIRQYGDQSTVMIEDELTSRYYRIGMSEYTFFSLLDGRTTFAAALGKTAAIMKERALTEEQAAGFCQWLVQSGLATTPHSRSVERLTEAAGQRRDRETKGMFSAISQKIPLFHPDALVAGLNSFCGWMFSGFAILIWCGLVACGLFTLITNWDQFFAGSTEIVSRSNWFWGIATWIVLKLIHESAHAVACKRFGGNVREAGVLFILFVPLPYVDLTSAWRFGSKWQRILTSAAGMMAELALASIAIIVWSKTEPGLLHQHMYNVVFIAGLSTILFNLNPLMRFDGYYILSDLFNLPNLASHGQQALSYYGKKWGLGLNVKAPQWPEGHALTFITYGTLAFAWRILVCLGLLFGAEVLLLGAGRVLALICVMLWVVMPLTKLLKFVVFGTETSHPSKIRFATVVGSLCLGGWLLATYVPWMGREEVPAVVDYYPRSELRTATSGFVEEWLVKNGQRVSPNTVIARLRNKEIETQFAEIGFDIAISQQRAASYLQQQQFAAWQVEQEAIVALRKRHADLSKQVASLIVRAPQAGVVLTEQTDDATGRYLNAGDLLAIIGPPERRELIALVDQRKFAAFEQQTGALVRVHVDGLNCKWSDAKLTEVVPRASRTIPHLSLAATTGGPLDVRSATTHSSSNSNNEQEYELLEPHFVARISIPREIESKVNRGQRATIALPSQDANLGEHVTRRLSNWWQQKTAQLHDELYR